MAYHPWIPPRMTRLERVAREVLTWRRWWGNEWAERYLAVALIADQRERDHQALTEIASNLDC